MTNPPDPDKATLSEDELRLLGKLDERTERIDGKVDRVIDATNENSDRITTNGEKIKRNTTVITGFTGGASMVLLWLSDKITRLL